MRAEPVWDPEYHPGAWRAIWSYSAKRARRDQKTLAAQEARARAIVDGSKKAKAARFVKVRGDDRAVDEASLARAQSLVGLKGYVTNVPAAVMPATEVIAKYHALWHVEKSFRMSKTDLDARPMFNRMRDAIEAHLTIVFTALAVSTPSSPAPGFPSARSSSSCGRCAARPSTSTAPRRPSRPRFPKLSARSSPTSASNPGTKRNVQTQVIGRVVAWGGPRPSEVLKFADFRRRKATEGLV